MKRILVLLISLALIVSLVGCSSSKKQNDDSKKNSYIEYANVPDVLIDTWHTNLGANAGGFVDADGVEHFIQQTITFNEDKSCVWEDSTGTNYVGAWEYDDATKTITTILRVTDTIFTFTAKYKLTQYGGKDVLLLEAESSLPQYYYLEKDFEIKN